MPRRTPLVLGFVLVPLLAVVLIVLNRSHVNRDPEATPPSRSAEDVGLKGSHAASHPAITIGGPESHEGKRRAVPPVESVTFTVLDEGGIAVPHASILSGATNGGKLQDTSALKVLGTTGTDGTVLVLAHLLPSRPPVVSIRRDQYAPSAVWHPAAATFHTVILTRAHDVRVQCEDMSGRPIRGALVLLSRVGISQEDIVAVSRLASPTHGMDPRGSVFAATTNGDGKAVIRSLPAGRYHHRVVCDGYFMLAADGYSTPQDDCIDVPCDTRRYILARQHVGVFTVVGDALVDHVSGGVRASDNRVLFKGRRVWRTDPSSSWLAQILRRRFPDCLVFVENPNPEHALAGTGPTVRLDLRTKSGRRVVLERALVPMTDTLMPQVIDTRELSGTEPIAYGDMAIVAVDGTGTTLRVGPFSAAPDQGDEPTRDVWAGRLQRLPVGKYRLGWGYGGRLGEEIGTKRLVVTEESRGAATIALEAAYAPVRVDVRGPMNEPVAHPVIQVEDGGRTPARAISLESEGSVHMWVQIGTWRFIVRAPGYRTLVDACRIDAYNGQTQTLTLRLAYPD